MKIALRELSFDSAIVRRQPKTEIGLFLIREDQTSGRSIGRGTDVVRWLVTIIEKLVLPNQKKSRMNKRAF